MLIAAFAAVTLFPSLSVLSTPDFDVSDKEATVASRGRSSLSWTSQDLLSQVKGKLRPDRAVVVPLSCNKDGEISTWVLMLGRTANRLRTQFPGAPPSSNDALHKHIEGQAGKPAGTVSRLELSDADIYRLAGISEFIFVCVAATGSATDRQIDQIASEILRVARVEASRGKISQVAIPRIPIILTGQDAPDDGGLNAFWASAVKSGLEGLSPNSDLDVLFGLYALTRKDNRVIFVPIAEEAVARMESVDPPMRTVILMTSICFAGASLSAWYRRRQFRPGYVIAMFCFCTAGMGAILALFSIDALGGLFVRSWSSSVLRLLAAFIIGLFGENLIRFDWKRTFTE